ncbi:MAG: dTDP-4-dehydrorhamnose 3,5-epimerase [Candidatus Erwinia impunctatus]|nr:dTDP-4-dehydrorhamnose 3,5-epimerase [Culicoides impunctatus]
MEVIDTRIAGVKVTEPKIFGDQRGFFFETFQKQCYQEFIDIENDFVQDNHSRSIRCVLRVLHFQPSCPQGKLVCTLRGEVYAVVVDIRPNSPSLKQWWGSICLRTTSSSFGSHQTLHIVFGVKCASLNKSDLG